MSIASGVLLAVEIAAMLPEMIKAGMNVWRAVQHIKDIANNETAPGSQERATLEAAIVIAEAEFDRLSKPRPPGT